MGLAGPGVAGGEEGRDGGVVLWGRGCRGGGGAGGTAGTARLGHHRLVAGAPERREAPRVHRRAVLASVADVLGRAEEADVQVVVVGRARLAGEITEALDHAAGCARARSL